MFVFVLKESKSSTWHALHSIHGGCALSLLILQWTVTADVMCDQPHGLRGDPYGSPMDSLSPISDYLSQALT